MSFGNFDQTTTKLSLATSRRDSLKLMAVIAGSGVLTLFNGRRAFATDPGQCRTVGQVCRENTECCSMFCDPTTGRCDCGPSSQLCPGTNFCVPVCSGLQVFNPSTCACECADVTCGNNCCASYETCVGENCCANPVPCTATNQCCAGFKCEGAEKGLPGTCIPCTNPGTCGPKSACCPGYTCVQAVPGSSSAGICVLSSSLAA